MNKLKNIPDRAKGVKFKLPKTRRIRWARRILLFFIFIAVFGDFIANDKPFFAKRNDQISFPILKSYMVQLGLAKWPPEVFQNGWKNLEYQSVVWAPIPYSSNYLDRRNSGFVSPFGPQKTAGFRDWHWLGTDQLGRDTAAGLITGTRTAMLVGLISMSIAAFIGILFGGLAGFFGDEGLKFSRLRFWLMGLGVALGIFWGFIGRPFASTTAFTLNSFLLAMLVLAIPVLLAYWLGKWIEKKWQLEKNTAFQMDLMMMRFIEILGSIPGLLLILAVIAIFESSSLYLIMMIIGFLFWPRIARYMRGEMIRLRTSNFVESLRAMGYSDLRILFRHCIPNGLPPVMITIAFGMGGAILAEAALSFIGIGGSIEDVSWGSMLNEARRNFSAWWLALMPGILIFLTIGSLNIIGEGISAALRPGDTKV